MPSFCNTKQGCGVWGGGGERGSGSVLEGLSLEIDIRKAALCTTASAGLNKGPSRAGIPSFCGKSFVDGGGGGQERGGRGQAVCL
jgi:hypothetical protein